MTRPHSEHSPMGYGDADARPSGDGDPTDPAAFEDSAGQDMSAAKPPHGADDGKSGGSTAGTRGRPNFAQDSHDTNVLTGETKGAEREKAAPGISTNKRSDDTK